MNKNTQANQIICTGITFRDETCERYPDGRCTFTFSGPSREILDMHEEIYNGCSCTINFDDDYMNNGDEIQTINLHTQRYEEEVLKNQLKHFDVTFA